MHCSAHPNAKPQGVPAPPCRRRRWRKRGVRARAGREAPARLLQAAEGAQVPALLARNAHGGLALLGHADVVQEAASKPRHEVGGAHDLGVPCAHLVRGSEHGLGAVPSPREAVAGERQANAVAAVDGGALVEHGIAAAAPEAEHVAPAAAAGVPGALRPGPQQEATALPGDAVLGDRQAYAEAPVPRCRAGAVVVHPPVARAVLDDLGGGHEEVVPTARRPRGEGLAPFSPAARRSAEGHAGALPHAAEGPRPQLHRLPAAAEVVEPLAPEAPHAHERGVEAVGAGARRERRPARQRPVHAGPCQTVVAAGLADAAHGELYDVLLGPLAPAVVQHPPCVGCALRRRLHPDAAEREPVEAAGLPRRKAQDRRVGGCGRCPASRGARGATHAVQQVPPLQPCGGG
mmetsp:Transcript_48980/g.151901  ORF Transcript_48980/g.151901 Transcript_48980/m.151901 type:complete len:404 (-) Transcript_48980:179-1390(-)